MDEALFVPRDETTVTERLTRAPDLYSWADVQLGDGAVAGVWASGETRTSRRDGEVVSSTRAAVLDYGFATGAEAELEALLRAWCARLSSRGVSHLGIFSSPPSPGFELLSGLGDVAEPYDVCVPSHESPPDLTSTGVFTDAVYF
jgi:hypothetical protein